MKPKNIEILRTYVNAADRYEAHRGLIYNVGGSILKEAQAYLGLSVRKMAEALHTEPAYLSKIQNNKDTLSPEMTRKVLGLLLAEEARRQGLVDESGKLVEKEIGNDGRKN